MNPEKFENIKKEEVKFRKICSWCGKDMGEIEGTSGDSHGICPDCREEHFPKQKKA